MPRRRKDRSRRTLPSPAVRFYSTRIPAPGLAPFPRSCSQPSTPDRAESRDLSVWQPLTGGGKTSDSARKRRADLVADRSNNERILPGCRARHCNPGTPTGEAQPKFSRSVGFLLYRSPNRDSQFSNLKARFFDHAAASAESQTLTPPTKETH